MSKTLLTFATLTACIAACAVSVIPALAAGGDKPDVTSTLKVKYKEADASDPYGKSTFKGTVGPKKCAKARSVTIKGYGKEKTNSNGKFELELTGPASPGRYKVKVAAKGSCLKVKATVTIKQAG